ncbi:hypothetical protein [Treponema sp. J25]|uniref:hypothetical protein n=1 Tax=Treponema sp. J25 TaxID=2094121 RepID=UPI00104A7E1C|nr:hypothetical protein [Treponema sp. J25]TCW60273.1 hypothetical protein C5O22_12090 [Treponema sp. J25]
MRHGGAFFLIGMVLLGWLVPARAFTLEDPPWLVLEKGKQLFRKGEYGTALGYFEQARDLQKKRYERFREDFITILSVAEVRRLGDSLPDVERYISEKNLQRGKEIIQELQYRASSERLKNSVQQALEILKELQQYPEAEYWIGEVYRVTGETAIALMQYKKAYEQRSALQEPDFALHILYAMVDVYKARGEYIEYEKTLLAVLENDPWWIKDTFIKKAMQRTLFQEGIEKFLTIYRYDKALFEKAHRYLGFYYYQTGRYERAAEHFIFSFLIQNTLLIEELKRQVFEYTYTTYPDMLGRLMKVPTILEYVKTEEYFKMLYYGAASFYAVGERFLAQKIWGYVATYSAEQEWKSRSSRQLQKPFIEPVNDKPW